MNPRLRKEAVLLAPGFLVALLLVAVPLGSPVWIHWLYNPPYNTGFLQISILAYWTATILTATIVFGSELNLGTLNHMWTQPLPRGVLWREKIFILMGALAILALAYSLAWPIFQSSLTTEALHSFYRNSILLAPVYALGCAPIAILLLRNANGVFLLLAVLAGGLMLWSEELAAFLNLEAHASQVHAGLVFALSGIGFYAGWRQWTRGQDAGFAEQEFVVHLRRWLPIARGKTVREFKKSSAAGALVRKELWLQQVNFLFLGVFLVLLLASLSWTAISETARIKYLDAIMLGGRIAACLAPLFIGAVMVAEERKMQLDLWHLSFPPSKRLQWCVKCGLCLCLGLVAGGGLHFLLDHADKLFPLLSPHMREYRTGETIFEANLFYVILPISAAFVGLAASSMSRHFIQALSLAVFMGFVVVVFHYFSSLGWRQIHDVFPAALIVVIGSPLLWSTCCTMGYWNFARPGGDGQRALVINVCSFALLMMVTIATAAFAYYRCWEIPFSVSPWQERFAQRTERLPQISEGRHYTVLIAGDGSLWLLDRNLEESPSLQEVLRGKSDAFRQIGKGFKWKQALAKRNGLIVLRDDGTLWAMGDTNHRFGDNPLRGGVLGLPEKRVYSELTQIGEDKDWIQIAGEGFHTIALKEDGSLWAWGRNAGHRLGYDDESMILNSPTRVGAGSDWIDIEVSPGNFALKSDGTLWRWGRELERARQPGLERSPLPLRIEGIPATRRIASYGNGSVLGGVTEQGGVWLRNSWIHQPEQAQSLFSNLGLFEFPPDQPQLYDFSFSHEYIQRNVSFNLFTNVRKNATHLEWVWADYPPHRSSQERLAFTMDGSLWVIPPSSREDDSRTEVRFIPDRFRPVLVGQLADGSNYR